MKLCFTLILGQHDTSFTDMPFVVSKFMQWKTSQAENKIIGQDRGHCKHGGHCKNILHYWSYYKYDNISSCRTRRIWHLEIHHVDHSWIKYKKKNEYVYILKGMYYMTFKINKNESRFILPWIVCAESFPKNQYWRLLERIIW